MEKWLERKSTTNILLCAIAALLGAHLMLNLPVIPSAKAQSLKTTQDDFLKSMDKNMQSVKENSDSMRTDIRQIQECIVYTPTGGKALQTKAVRIQ